MRKKILATLAIISYIIMIIAPVIGVSENKPKDFIRYINGDTPKDPSKYTKVYDNVFIFGIGHNQKEIDEKYKVGDKWIIKDAIGEREWDLVIAPYTGNGYGDSGLAGLEQIGLPVVSTKAFAPYKGSLFRNVETHSGGGPALKNQVDYGTIDYEKATLSAYPRTFSKDVDQKDTYVVNKGDWLVPYFPIVKYDAKEGRPGIRVGWTLHFGPGESKIKKGPGVGHELREYYKKKNIDSIESQNDGTSIPISVTPSSTENAIPTVTELTIPLSTDNPVPTSTDPPYPPPTNTPPPWDDNNGGGGLGGVDFTGVNINYISSDIYNDRNNTFNYIFKMKRADNGDNIINIEDAAGLSINSFFVGLTIPKSEFWVNLNLWEPDRIIEKDLETTDIGRIMLESDLRMKKNFGKYEDPCKSEIGIKYWKLLEKKREELVSNVMKKYPDDIKDINNVQFIPVTRYWIISDKLDAYEDDNEIYIINATMGISSEPVYDHSEYQIINQNTLFMSKSSKEELDKASKEYGLYVKELEGETILPLVVQDVNKDYHELMRAYISLALAQWYKDKYRNSNSQFADFIDSKNLIGLESKPVWSAEDIWKDYKKSFEEGDYNCWKNETYKQDDYTITSSKLYVGGGVDFTNIKITNKGTIPESLKVLISDATSGLVINSVNDYYFGNELYFENSNDNSNSEGQYDDSNQADNNIKDISREKLPNEDQKTPGFTIGLVFAAIAILVFLKNGGRM